MRGLSKITSSPKDGGIIGGNSHRIYDDDDSDDQNHCLLLPWKMWLLDGWEGEMEIERQSGKRKKTREKKKRNIKQPQEER